jgi:hypothetical protein
MGKPPKPRDDAGIGNVHGPREISRPDPAIIVELGVYRHRLEGSYVDSEGPIHQIPCSQRHLIDGWMISSRDKHSQPG